MPSNLQVMYLVYGEVPAVGPRGNLANVLRVTVKIGDYGPFTKDFAPDTEPAVVQQWVSSKQAAVQAVCGCS